MTTSSSCPEPHVTVSVTCVTKGASTYDAVFAYANPGPAIVNVPIGPKNDVQPGGDRGQPTCFSVGSGSQPFILTGVPNGTPAVWTLTSGGSPSIATASVSSTPCSGPPGPKPITVSVQCVQNNVTTYDALFGYDNPNAGDVTIQAGPDNGFSPEPVNRGQVTTFHPGAKHSAFTVPGIPANDPITWSVTYAGQTSSTTTSFASCPEPPKPGSPKIGIFVRCVTNDGATFDATFGYQNDDLTPVTIPVGDANKFSPVPQDRGQTTVFQPGNIQEAFTVKGIPSGQDLVWTLTSNGTRTATASANFVTKCADPPPPAKPIGVFVTCIDKHDSTYDATFGYENDNNVAETIEIGPGNAFSPAPIDRGQPTVFVPGRTEQAVVVHGIPATTDLTWTVAYDGTRQAIATAAPPSTATANPSSPLCSTTPTPPDPPGPKPPKPPRPLGIFAHCVINNGRTYDAVFGS
jgi:hypothetical protein